MIIKLVYSENFPQLRKLRSSFKVSDKGDICIAVGGDGAFVSAAKEFGGPILPIRSNKSGSSGYYADLSLADLDFVIKSLKAGAYVVEKLENKIEIAYKGRKHYAVNEVSLRNMHQEVNFKIYDVNGGTRSEIYPYVMGGDGIIISGATGSTAYNKSAGGPIILSPNVFCLTFLNADGPYNNPIIIDANRKIEIRVAKYVGILDADGKKIAELKPGEKFDVRLSTRELRVVRFPDRRESMASKLDRIIRSRMVKDF
jgi:NAD+ kinase